MATPISAVKDARVDLVAYLHSTHPDALERAERIGTTLKALADAGRDRAAIEDALEEGIWVWDRERVRKNNQENVRHSLARHERILRHARLTLENLEKVYADGSEDSDQLESLEKVYAQWNEYSDHLRALRDIIAELDHDLSNMKEQIRATGWPLRRATRGKPQEHVVLIHKRLAALRVLPVDRTELLQALGFLPETL